MSIEIQWPLVLFTLIAGAGCGLLTATAFASLNDTQNKKTTQIALVTTLVLLGVGGLMSVLHLAHPERFMSAVANLLSFSGIALELIGLALSGVAALLLLAFASADNRAGVKVVAFCSIIIGIAASFLHGYAYYEVIAQLGWNTITLPLSYMLTSLTTGALFFVAIASFTSSDKKIVQFMGKGALVLAILATIAIIAYVVALGGAEAFGDAALPFAVLTIGIELITAVLVAWFVLKKDSRSVIIGSLIGAICGGLSVRVLMWLVATYGFNFIERAVENIGLYVF